MRAKRLEDRIQWVRAQIESVKLNRTRAPWLILGVLLAIPGGLIFGVLGAVVTVVAVIGLVATTIYITSVHLYDYRSELADLERMLANESNTERN